MAKNYHISHKKISTRELPYWFFYMVVLLSSCVPAIPENLESPNLESSNIAETVEALQLQLTELENSAELSDDVILGTAQAIVEATMQALPTNLPTQASPTLTLETVQASPSSTPEIILTFPPAQLRSILTGNSVNVRSGPNTCHAPAIDFLPEGEIVEVLGKNHDVTWYRVRLSNGTIGWVSIEVTELIDNGIMQDIPTVLEIPNCPNLPTPTPKIVPPNTLSPKNDSPSPTDTIEPYPASATSTPKPTPTSYPYPIPPTSTPNPQPSDTPQPTSYP